MRLQRMIALSSDLSRRAAEEAISRGEVTVNGEVVTALGTTVDPLKDRVELCGNPLKISARRTYLAFFKPRDVLVTKSDPHHRPTIWDQLGELKRTLNAVGRLDFESDGLLLLSDDGNFINRLTHPKHEVWKIYHVRVKGVPDAPGMTALANGIELDDGMTLPARVKRLDKGTVNALLEIGIREGRNRQVRRMCDAVGCPVIKLRRVAIGPVQLGRLRPGRHRSLTAEEVEKLLQLSERGEGRR